MIIGKDIELECPFKNYDKITWTKDGVQLENQTKTLTFQDINLSENGTYTCTASNAAGSDVFDHTILINFPPIFNNKEENASTLNVIFANDLKLDCDVDGYPVPQVRCIHQFFG